MRKLLAALCNILACILLAYAIGKCLFVGETTGSRTLGNLGGMLVGISMMLQWPWSEK